MQTSAEETCKYYWNLSNKKNCSEIRFSKIWYHMEISQLICSGNQLTGDKSFDWKVFPNRL